MQDHCAADGETPHRSKRHQLAQLGGQAEAVGEQGRQGKRDAQKVEPHGCVHHSGLAAIAKAQLQHDGDRPDGSHHNRGQGTEKSRAIGEGHDQCQYPAQQAGGNHSPTTRPKPGAWQEFSPPPFYTGVAVSFKVGGHGKLGTKSGRAEGGLGLRRGGFHSREPRLRKPKLWRQWNKTGTFGRGPKAAPVVLVHAFS